MPVARHTAFLPCNVGSRSRRSFISVAGIPPYTGEPIAPLHAWTHSG